MISTKQTAPQLDIPMTLTEEETVRGYDRQRRQRLLILLGAVFGGAIGVLFMLVVMLTIIVPQPGPVVIVGLAGVAINALVYFGVVVLARSNRVEAASALFAVGAGIIPNLNILSGSATGGTNPFTVVFLMGAIVIVSLAGRPWMVLGTALFSSLTTVYMVLFAPIPTDTPAQAALHTYIMATGATTLPILFVAYWGMALLLLAQWRSYQRLLLELADVRVQVERARQLDELKDQFIRSVNHELRTPIMTLLGYIDLLMNPENRQSAEKVDRYIQRAARAGQSLRRLLAGILDTRRINTTTHEFLPERLDVMAALEEIIPMLPIDAQNGHEVERPLRVKIIAGIQVWAEPFQFQQILVNLLTNAVKYSDPGTPVDIDVQIVTNATTKRKHLLARREESLPMVEIVVRDYGLGIPPEQQPLLFQRFMRLPRELESPVMGTGLGLYLCKAMVEQMNGTIRVTSSGIVGEGTAFHVQLPPPPTSPEQPRHDSVPIVIERRTGPLVGTFSGTQE